jgi:Flp pilus assembly protein TadG
MREESGVEVLEAALVLPLLFMLVLGIVWLGRAYNVYASITRAAREGARYAAAPTCSTCGSIPPSPTQVQAVVDGALSAASLDPTKKLNYSFTRGTTLNQGSAYATETGVVVSFGYPVQLAIPFTSLNNTTINISTTVQMRDENQ